MEKNSMKIIGIGIDIIEVARIKDAVTKKKSLITRVFSNIELRMSERGQFRYEELAGRFAVKEAVFKAIKTGWRSGVAFRDVTVLNEPSGAPYVKLGGRAGEIAAKLGVKNIFVSISHVKEMAVGMVILTS
jgi:holo-[acyl-carrier protein] synthase